MLATAYPNGELWNWLSLHPAEMRKSHVKAAVLLFCFLPCVLLQCTYFCFWFQSLQALTTGRNCQLDNAEESLHVITTGISIGILLKRLLQVTSARQLNFPLTLLWLISCGKKKDFGRTIWVTQGYFFANPTPSTCHGLSTQDFS